MSSAHPRTVPLAARLAAGPTVVTSELNPPKGTDLQPLLETARRLVGWVDAFNLTDCHNARMAMAPLGAARRLLDAGAAPILQLTSRDRNRLALQADLLAAAALGVTDVLLMGGDHPRHGDHPDAKPVFDLDTLELIGAASTLTAGQDLQGNRLRGAPRFNIGAVVNPGSHDLEAEIARMEQKVRAGAAFFQTQAVYDPAAFERFVRRIEFLAVPVLAGILPVHSARMARYLNEHVPGIEVPESLVRRITAAPAAETAAIETAAELVREVRAACRGVHIMAIGRERLIPAILDAAGVEPRTPPG